MVVYRKRRPQQQPVQRLSRAAHMSFVSFFLSLLWRNQSVSERQEASSHRFVFTASPETTSVPAGGKPHCLLPLARTGYNTHEGR